MDVYQKTVNLQTLREFLQPHVAPSLWEMQIQPIISDTESSDVDKSM